MNEQGRHLAAWRWYSPMAARALALLALLVVGLFVLIEAGVIEYAYGKRGVVMCSRERKASIPVFPGWPTKSPAMSLTASR